jgi:hypothetical protein
MKKKLAALQHTDTSIYDVRKTNSKQTKTKYASNKTKNNTHSYRV